MTFWNDKQADAAHLRLFVPGDGWRAFKDKMNDEGDRVEEPGTQRTIESSLLNVLNATNVVVLTGTGSSFAARNDVGKPTPAGMWDVWQAVEAEVGPATFKEVCDSFASARIEDNIERLLTLCKLYLELHETAVEDATFLRIRDFVATAEKAILARVDFVDWTTNLDAHAGLIQKIGRRSVRKARSKLFTTNYDLCFEEAARRHRFTIIDGFSHGLDQIYDRSQFEFDIVRRSGLRDAPDYIENVFHLYKLHGSLDWRRKGAEIYRSRGPEGDPVLIYPRSSKYQESFDAPYLDMISALQAALREPDTAVLISGFGFNDDHISRPILSAVEANMSLRLVICDPAFIPAAALNATDQSMTTVVEPQNRFLAAFKRMAEVGDARIHLINGRFQDLVSALPDLIGETDRERHMQRVRMLRDSMDITA
ncbi:SIR2 family protein [Gluconacetobacter diazotrophicus]|uniref:Uncharacterized protein n=1 Tax=Gluconacetobacter diazotrophicus (strain ATCC 49037 / DSM 5601 / CCUG 37298 / CIP 103539 / LMG 7603 / PAl5) TaxID=272568 RepID=A9HC61_GLUDA|nr:SIR2 family protein [Gluconacetobacter diazotrophicus]CAP54903.1 conserved hypothetical protein [Gluconacetobacter diazotrophicus PA1 5]